MFRVIAHRGSVPCPPVFWTWLCLCLHRGQWLALHQLPRLSLPICSPFRPEITSLNPAAPCRAHLSTLGFLPGPSAHHSAAPRGLTLISSAWQSRCSVFTGSRATSPDPARFLLLPVPPLPRLPFLLVFRGLCLPLLSILHSPVPPLSVPILYLPLEAGSEDLVVGLATSLELGKSQ